MVWGSFAAVGARNDPACRTAAAAPEVTEVSKNFKGGGVVPSGACNSAPTSWLLERGTDGLSAVLMISLLVVNSPQ